MITQAILVFSNKRAILFCRGNALYISYIHNNMPSEPMVVQNGIENGFNVNPDKNGFLVFYKRTGVGATSVKITSSGAFRYEAGSSILPDSSDDVLMGVNGECDDVIFSKDGSVYSMNDRKRILEYGKNGFIRTVFLGKEGLILYKSGSALRGYSYVYRHSYEISRAVENIKDISFCSQGKTIYLAFIIKNQASCDVIFKTINNGVVSKGMSVMKTAAAENVFIYFFENNIRVFVSSASKVLCRETYEDKIEFKNAESIDISGAAKIECFNLYGADRAYCDIMCRGDGTVVYPPLITNGNKGIRAENITGGRGFYNDMDYGRNIIIKSLKRQRNSLWNRPQMSEISNEKSLFKRNRLNYTINPGIKRREKNTESLNIDIEDKSKDCTIYYTLSKLIDDEEKDIKASEKKKKGEE